jgi:hypothetical protein
MKFEEYKKLPYNYKILCDNLGSTLKKLSMTPVENEEYVEPKHSFFNKNKKEENKYTKSIIHEFSFLSCYRAVDELLSSIYTDIVYCHNDNFGEQFIEFCKFVFFVEKYYYYSGDLSEAKYEVDDSTYKIIINKYVYKIVYEVTESLIDIPGQTSSTDYIYDFNMPNRKNNKKHVLFINLKVFGKYGEDIIASYETVDGSPINTTDIDDIVLYKDTMKMLKQVMMYTVLEILNTISENSSLEGKLSIDEIAKGKIKLWSYGSRTWKFF